MKDNLSKILFNSNIVIVVLFSALFFTGTLNAAPAGWTVSISGGEHAWSKTFPQGKLNAYISDWKILRNQSVKSWLKKNKSVTQAGNSVKSKKIKIKKSRLKNSYYVMRNLNKLRGKKRISLLTACENNGFVRTIEVIGEQKIFSKSGKKAIRESVLLMQEACKEKPNATGQDIKPQMKTAGTKKSLSKQKAVAKNFPTKALGSTSPPRGLKDIRGIQVYGIQVGGLFGLKSNLIAIFKDGTYTSDMKRVFADGVVASRAAKPNRWGKWRMKGGNLELKNKKDKGFEKARADWITTPGSSNHKLNGCYGNITSSSSTPYGGNTTVGNASTWCFKPNGRFSHSSTGFATASGNVRGGTSSSSKSRGRYRIDAYTANFVYDDGKEIKTAFCYLNEEHTHIAINGKRYRGSK